MNLDSIVFTVSFLQFTSSGLGGCGDEMLRCLEVWHWFEAICLTARGPLWSSGGREPFAKFLCNQTDKIRTFSSFSCVTLNALVFFATELAGSATAMTMEWHPAFKTPGWRHFMLGTYGNIYEQSISVWMFASSKVHPSSFQNVQKTCLYCENPAVAALAGLEAK